jgi:hypothetical protein
MPAWDSSSATGAVYRESGLHTTYGRAPDRGMVVAGLRAPRGVMRAGGVHTEPRGVLWGLRPRESMGDGHVFARS